MVDLELSQDNKFAMVNGTREMIFQHNTSPLLMMSLSVNGQWTIGTRMRASCLTASGTWKRSPECPAASSSTTLQIFQVTTVAWIRKAPWYNVEALCIPRRRLFCTRVFMTWPARTMSWKLHNTTLYLRYVISIQHSDTKICLNCCQRGYLRYLLPHCSTDWQWIQGKNSERAWRGGKLNWDTR